MHRSLLLLISSTILALVIAAPWPPSSSQSCAWLESWCSDCQNSNCGNLKSKSMFKSCVKSHCKSKDREGNPGVCTQLDTAHTCLRICQKNGSSCNHCCDMQGGMDDIDDTDA